MTDIADAMALALWRRPNAAPARYKVLQWPITERFAPQGAYANVSVGNTCVCKWSRHVIK